SPLEGVAGCEPEGGRASAETAKHRAVSAVIADLLVIIADGAQGCARPADVAGHGGLRMPFRAGTVFRLGVVAVECYPDHAGYIPAHGGFVPGAGHGHVGAPAMKGDVRHRVLAIMSGGHVDHA